MHCSPGEAFLDPDLKFWPLNTKKISRGKISGFFIKYKQLLARRENTASRIHFFHSYTVKYGSALFELSPPKGSG